jgi:hypothetical protein
MNGIIKPKKDMPIITNPSTLIKILIYGGIVLFIFLNIVGLIGKRP